MQDSHVIRDIDITRATGTFRAMNLVQVVARIVYTIGVPLSVFVLVFEHAKSEPMQTKLLAWAGFGVLSCVIVLLGFSFARLTLRPMLGAVFVALGAGPAMHAMFVYLQSGDNWQETAIFALLAGVLSAPLVWAWIRLAGLSKTERRLARHAPPITSPLALVREVFSVWPGLKRSFFSGLLATGFSHLATLIVWVGGLIITPVAILSILLTPLLAHKEGVSAPLILAGVILLALWVMIAAQAVLRSGARWLSRASLDAQVTRDKRPPILFLRSFQDDQVGLPERLPALGLIRRIFTLGLGRRRLDHILIERFSRYGPALALGNPGEKDLPFGAARVYAEHSNWKDVVAQLAERSDHVVLVADRTPGVEWEIRTFLDGPWRPKTVFVCAPQSADLRDNPILAERLDQCGVSREGRPVIAVYWDENGCLNVLRAKMPRSPESFIVALQAFLAKL